MGYTHYWKFAKKVTDLNRDYGENRFKVAVDLFKEGLKKLPKEIELAGGMGEGEPIITDTEVCFNGKAPEDYETCYIGLESNGFDFCKTQHRPYDTAVCLLLMCMKAAFEEDFEFSSDGDMTEEGWVKAKEIYNEIAF